jgi:IS5 family transposase
MRACEKIASSGGANKGERLLKSAGSFLDLARRLEDKVRDDIAELRSRPLGLLQIVRLENVVYFHEMLVKHIDLVERRLVRKETIPHEEKVFSIFEPHTELIKKGKVRPPVEFGHRVLLSTEQHGLIIDYKVMEGGSEPGEIMPLVRRLSERFGKDSIASLSTDKGFASEENRKYAEEFIEMVVMPKKGKRNAAEREAEGGRKWRKFKNRHSTIESDINCLEQHGLNRCPDKGLDGYKRYVGLGVLAFNLHRIGAALLSARTGAKGRRRKKAS